MTDQAGGEALLFLLKIIEVKSEFVTFDGFELICFDLILNGLKLRFLGIYIPPSLFKYMKIVLNINDLIKHLHQKMFLSTFLVTLIFEIFIGVFQAQLLMNVIKVLLSFVPKIFKLKLKVHLHIKTVLFLI